MKNWKKRTVKMIDSILLSWTRREALLLAILLAVLLATGCANNGERVTDFWGSRYFYKCELPQYWIDRTLRVYGIQVLPWKEFNKVAWGHRVSPHTTRAFIQGTSIWLREDYSLDNLYHEIAHSWEHWQGNYADHGPGCWTNSKPWEYDATVRGAFESAELPSLAEEYL